MQVLQLLPIARQPPPTINFLLEIPAARGG
jgi:hypothetical protein